MTGVREVLSWPGLHLQKIGFAALGGALLLLVNIFWQPTVSPHMPAELRMSAQNEESLGGLLEEESLDFIFRPLFVTSRRPMERVVVAEAAAPEPLPSATSSSVLDGYQLLGVFSSGEGGGVILLNDAKERSRLAVGESLQGWVLDSTDLRSAHFRSDAGEQVELELAVASSLPLPPVTTWSATGSDQVRGEEGASGLGASQAKTESPPVHDGPVTFESIAARQKREIESQAKASDAKP